MNFWIRFAITWPCVGILFAWAYYRFAAARPPTPCCCPLPGCPAHHADGTPRHDERHERLASTSELQAIDIDLYDPCPPPTDRLCGCRRCRDDLMAGIEREVNR